MQILIPDSWLRDYLDTDASPREIQKALSLCGPSVERLHQKDGDFIYDIEVTTNRVDMMSVIGIAREAAAILPRFGHKAKFKKDPFSTASKLDYSPTVDYLKVTLDPTLCPRFTAILIRNIEVKQSPAWLVKKLESVGMRSLNNVVDVSNYLMHLLGQPVHTFDYAKIHGATMLLRPSRKNEQLVTLDSKSHKLPGDDIVIEDGSGKLIDLCGIMGGLNSAVDLSTKNVLLFVQTYNPHSIRKTSMSLAHRTEAAVLFEKHLSPHSVPPTLELGVDLLTQICGGTPESVAIDLVAREPKSEPLSIVPSISAFVRPRLGVDLSPKEIKSILECLGFAVSNDTIITVPWWRQRDISLPEDILEEVARIYGYHNLPSTLMTGPLPTNRANDAEFYWISRIKNALKYWGFTETYTYSLVAESSGLKLKNPLSSDWVYLRTSLTPSLQQVVTENAGRVGELNLFEIANVYTPQKNNLPKESLHLVIASTNFGLNKLKGIIVSLQIEMGTHIDYTLLQETNLTILEADLTKSLATATSIKKYTPVSKFSPIIEDINVTYTPPYSDLEKKLSKISPLIKKIELVDKYGDKLTLRLTFHSATKQLSSKDIEPIRKRLMALE